MSSRRVSVRPLAAGDVAAAKDLLDRCFGAGFGHVDESLQEIAFIAQLDARLAGVATACLRSPVDLEAAYAGLVSWPADAPTQPYVALLGQIGVETDARDMGVGDALLDAAEREVLDRFEGRVGYWVANAWVHALTGHCPASHLLERQGFKAVGTVPDFFAGMPSEDCPGCGAAPCRCSVRVHFKTPAR